MNTKRHEYPWTCFAATMSWDKAPPGSAGVPPAQHWHSFTHFFDPARPAAAPGLCFGRARPFPPAGWPCAASRGNGAATVRRGCGRDARAPGGAPPPILIAPRGGTAPADAAEPSRFVSLRRPSCVFVDPSFFRLFQVRGRRRLSRAMVHRILNPALTVPERVPEILERPRRGR